MNSNRRLSAAIASLPSFISFLFLLSLAWDAPALGTEPAESAGTLVLVARPELSDPLYGQSILVAREVSGNQHVGFILNKPTGVKLGDAFPGHEATKAVADPLYLGGPAELNVLFALVQSKTAPEDGAVGLAEDLYLAISNTAVINAMSPGESDQSRFFVGAVVWGPGELAAEIKFGAWYVLEATADLVLTKNTAGLWEKLVQQAEMVANGI